MKILTTTLTLILTITCFSQNPKDIIGDLSRQTGTSLYIRPTITDPTIQKHYINAELKRAYIDGIDGVNKLRYNGLTDQMEYLNNDEVLNLVRNESVLIKFIYNDAKFKVFNYLDEKTNLKNRYLQILIDNPEKYSLYKSFEVSNVVNENKSSYQSIDDNKILTETNYFIGYNGLINEIPRSSKKINEIFKADFDQIIKSNKLNLKKEEDLKKLIDLLNK